MTARTRLLGVDFGTVRVGLAVSDLDRNIASPLALYRRRDRKQDAAYFRQVENGLYIRMALLAAVLGKL